MISNNALQGVPGDRDFVIADRRDLLGGRLMAILNGLRLAEKTNRRFLMTWRAGQDVSYFAFTTPLEELLVGDLITPYNPESGRGSIISIQDPLLAQTSEAYDAVFTEEQIGYGIKPLLLQPRMENGRPYKVSNRFTYFSVSGESSTTAQQELSALFTRLEKTAVVDEAIATLDQALASFGQLATVHVRRLHLTSPTNMLMARFDSYWSLESCKELINDLREDYDHILVGSDSDYLVAELKSAFPGKVLQIADVIDLAHLTPLQRTLVEIVFLSKGEKIFGPLSAFSILAATIGNAKYHNSLVYLASKNLLKGDQTHAIGLLKCLQNSKLTKPLADAADQAGNSSMALRQMPLRGISRETLGLAIRILARLVTEYPHATFKLNCGEHIAAIERPAKKLKVPFLAAVESLEPAISSPHFGTPEQLEHLTVEAQSDCRDRRHLALIKLVVAADRLAAKQQHKDALDLFHQTLVLSYQLGLTPRGLLLRRSRLMAKTWGIQFCLDDCRRAVKLDPSFAPSHYFLGSALVRSHLLEEALQAFRKSVELDPYVGQFWQAAAEVCGRLGLMADAELYRKNVQACDVTGTEFYLGT